MSFFYLTSSGIYQEIQPTPDGVIRSQVLPGFQFRIEDLYNQTPLDKLVDDPVYQQFIWPEYLAERQRGDREEERTDREKERANSEKERADNAALLIKSEKERADSAEERAGSEKMRADKAVLLIKSETERADSEKERADNAQKEAEIARQQNESLINKLRELGIDPLSFHDNRHLSVPISSSE